MSKISIGNPNIAKWAKGTAITVYFMTGVKAAVRPVFIMGDKKNNDKQAKKYTAVKEVLYQILCLGVAAAMIPFAERYGFKLAEKQLGKIAELKNKNITKLEQIDGFKELANLKGFNLKGSKKVNAFKDLYLNETFNETKTLSKEADDAMHVLNGGVETGSFLASILGLTLLAPMISHEILHPIMHALKMDKKGKDVGQPSEIFLADAKNPTEKTGKLNAKA